MSTLAVAALGGCLGVLVARAGLWCLRQGLGALAGLVIERKLRGRS